SFTHKANTESKFVYDRFNHMLKEFDKSYHNSLEKFAHSESCTTFLVQANNVILSSSHIRSIGLVENGIITCNTISGKSAIPLEDTLDMGNKTVEITFVKQKIRSTFNSDHSGLIVVHFGLGNESIVGFVLHPQEITEALRNTNSDFSNFIRIKNTIISPDGMSWIAEPKDIVVESQQTSLFSTGYYYSLMSFSTFLVRDYGYILFLWLFAGVAIANHLYRYLSNVDLLTLKIQVGIRRHEFIPYLQPLFDRSGFMIGAEVLVRWKRNGEILSPYHFIDRAEHTGQIKEITTHLMVEVASKLKLYNQNHRSIPLHIGFNASAVQFSDDMLLNDCRQFQRELEGQNYSLVIEITERLELPGESIYIQKINALKEENVLIALDDFGTGHCSLKYLHQMDVDYLKVDRSYVKAINSSNYRIELLDNVIDLAQRLNVETIAEGVETEAQEQYLRDKNVTLYQGYLYEKPISIEEFIDKYIKTS
ncbi:cyclic diguanylate phosphodiesterase, partial [Vibrio sp.]|nr:cyclic diguanylate phosphodiesterase [Vibrio sp.]